MFVYKNKHLSSFFFFHSLHLDSARPAGAGGGRRERGVSRKSAHIYSKHKHAKSEDKPLQIQL